jgi:flagellar biosynthesis GTPase FlhF
MPRIAMNAEKDAVTLAHDLNPKEFFGGKPIPPETRWMVFKVKRRAEKSYFAITADATDDSRFKFDFKVGGSTVSGMPPYSYNWPYDFFSLSELAKLDVSTEHKIVESTNEIIQTPSDEELEAEAQEAETRPKPLEIPKKSDDFIKQKSEEEKRQELLKEKAEKALQEAKNRAEKEKIKKMEKKVEEEKTRLEEMKRREEERKLKDMKPDDLKKLRELRKMDGSSDRDKKR